MTETQFNSLSNQHLKVPLTKSYDHKHHNRIIIILVNKAISMIKFVILWPDGESPLQRAAPFQTTPITSGIAPENETWLWWQWWQCWQWLLWWPLWPWRLWWRLHQTQVPRMNPIKKELFKVWSQTLVTGVSPVWLKFWILCCCHTSYLSLTPLTALV